jgi:hypothetical protein
MEVRSLTLADRVSWASLLAVCFDRTPGQMDRLLTWFHDGFPLVAMGAWDGDRLVAQYNCRLLELLVPGSAGPVPAGMGLNMAVDPGYRGQGLLDRVAAPVHEAIAELGCVAGVGFSSAGGLAVTRASASYAYRVLGPMDSVAVPLVRRRYPDPLPLSDDWPDDSMALAPPDDGLVRYRVTPPSLRHRFAQHPFRRYVFAARRAGGTVDGLVVYRRTSLRGIPAASLLAAYGGDVPGLLGSWAGALRRDGVPLVHVLLSPASPLREAIRSMGPRITLPISRNPYHLIARALAPEAPDILFDLQRWDCAGGDIL